MKKNKKYQVFISSTYLDLREERQEAVQSILKMGHIPAGMELFKAGKSQWQTITKWIDDSDIYVLILGGRYGSINTSEGKSYTEMEYNYALENGKPLFALVLNDEFLEKKASLEGKEKIYEKNNIEKYHSFKNLVESKIVKYVEDIKDIKIEIPDNINEMEKVHKLEGWSKGDSTEAIYKYMTENISLLKEKDKLNTEITKLKNKIDKLEKNKENKFSCGLSYDQLKEILYKHKIKIPRTIIGQEKETNLLDLSLNLSSSLSSGYNNRLGSTKEDIFIYNQIASPLAKYCLADLKKGPGQAIWSIITLNNEGKKFFSLFETELIKNKKEVSIV